MATLGPFLPGLAQEYETSVTARVTSSAGDSALSVADPSGGASGRLANGSFSLTQRVQARARNATNQSTVFAPVTADPLTLLTYADPMGADQVTIGLKQAILANEPLRTGLYTKTLTFTLSTTTP
jgi:3-oxoacyl-ACP reductase-like protein